MREEETGTLNDEKAIDALIEGWIGAHNRGDAQALAAFYAADADFVGIDGQTIRGRTAIVKMYEQVFLQLAGNRAEFTRCSRRMVPPHLAIDEGTWEVIGDVPPGAPRKGRSTTVFKKQNGQWLILAARTMVPVTRTALDG